MYLGALCSPQNDKFNKQQIGNSFILTLKVSKRPVTIQHSKWLGVFCPDILTVWKMEQNCPTRERLLNTSHWFSTDDLQLSRRSLGHKAPKHPQGPKGPPKPSAAYTPPVKTLKWLQNLTTVQCICPYLVTGHTYVHCIHWVSLGITVWVRVLSPLLTAYLRQTHIHCYH